MIKITNAASEKLKTILDENPGKYVRVLIRGIG